MFVRSWGLLLVFLAARLSYAQIPDNAPVALDDSPVADRILAEVEAQSSDNPRRAADLLADLLDEYADRVVPIPDQPEMFRSVRSAALEVLFQEASVRRAWRERCDAEALELLESAGPDETLRRRPMTKAGLEAAYRVAQRLIESGLASSGLRLLESIEEWPDAGTAVSSRRREILAAIAWIDLASSDGLASSQDARDEAIDLVRRHDPALAERISRWIVAGNELPIGSSSDRDPSLREWTVLWEAPLQDSLHRRRTVDRPTGRVLHSNPEGVRRSGTFLTSVPVVVGDLILVNEGHLIEAVDRYTGRLRWFRDFGSATEFGGSGRPVDLNEIVVDGEDAYTILGHSSGDRPDDRPIIRFDATTGRQRWEVRPDRIPDRPILEDAEACGAPLILGDLVLIPLRKVTPRLETIDLVMALNRSDGTIRWVRSIVSSGSMRNSIGRPVSRLAEIQGDVLIASSAGAVARLEGHTGSVLWLRREEVPLGGLASNDQAWQIASPIVLDRGLATLDASRRHWQLLDPETGRLLDRRPIGVGTISGPVARLEVVPRGLDGNRDLLLLIGSDIVAVDPENPSKPVWTLSAQARMAEIPIGSSDVTGVRGRVAIGIDSMLVPTADAVLSVNASTGRVAHLFEVDGPVNPVMAEDAIHMVAAESVATVMPVLEAVATLERRIRESPEAVPQAMGLLELAVRIGRRDLQLLAARAAVDGLVGEEGDLWREEVLDLLIASVATTGDEDGEVLLELAASVATDVAGRVRHRLARAAWLEVRGRVREAIAEWRGIVGDPSLASVLVRVGPDHSVAAGTVARGRLLAARAGDPELSASFDEDALALTRSAIESRETASVLMDLARSFAGSEAALMAGNRAIDILRDEGDPMSASAVAMVVARDLDSRDPRRIAFLEDAGTACADAGRPDLARQLSAMSRFPSQSPASPSVGGTPDHLDLLRGRVVRMTSAARRQAPTDFVLLFEPQAMELVARGADGLVERWRRPWSSDHLVIEWSPDLLIWEGMTHRQPILSSIDRETGAVRWSTPDVSRLLPPPDRHAIDTDGFLPDGTVFQPWEILSQPLDEGLLLIRRDGAASLVDRVDGRTVLWSRRGLLDRVHGITTGGGLVHLHGSGIDRRGDVVGRVVSLDPLSGRIVLDESIGSGEIRWAFADPLGRLAVGTATEIHVLDPLGQLIGGGDRWWRRRGGGDEIRLGWISMAGSLVLVDDASTIMVWDLSSGRVDADGWSVPEVRSELLGRPLATLELAEGRVLHLDARLILHDSNGEILGMDAMAIPGRRDQRVLPIQDGVLLVTRLTAAIPGGAVHRIQRLDTDAGLRLSGEPFEIAGGRPYAEVHAIDGWLLLSTEEETHAVPMSPSLDSNPDLPSRP
jgi:hypothetical protein